MLRVLIENIDITNMLRSEISCIQIMWIVIVGVGSGGGGRYIILHVPDFDY